MNDGYTYLFFLPPMAARDSVAVNYVLNHKDGIREPE